MVESGEETDRVLAGSRVHLCLDTGHLLIGGGDPVAVAVNHPERVGHVHLKDVRLDLAREVQEGQDTYTGAVARGMYVPLGQGDVDIAAIVTALEGSGYAGWYVLEQDTILTGAPEATGVDPVADVRASITHILGVARTLELTSRGV
jgi:inosose dehydratase